MKVMMDLGFKDNYDLVIIHIVDDETTIQLFLLPSKYFWLFTSAENDYDIVKHTLPMTRKEYICADILI